MFSGVIGEDITFFGFDIDQDEIDQWCFVLEEQMTEPRFGFDVAGDAARPAARHRRRSGAPCSRPRSPASRPTIRRRSTSSYNAYKALSWTHVDVAAGSYASVGNLISVPNKPFARSRR